MTLPTAFGISLKLWTNTCMPTHTPIHYQTHRNTVSVSHPQTIRHPNKHTIRHNQCQTHTRAVRHTYCQTPTHYQTHKHQCQTHTQTYFHTHYQTPTNTHTLSMSDTHKHTIRHMHTHYQTPIQTLHIHTRYPTYKHGQCQTATLTPSDSLFICGWCASNMVVGLPLQWSLQRVGKQHGHAVKETRQAGRLQNVGQAFVVQFTQPSKDFLPQTNKRSWNKICRCAQPCDLHLENSNPVFVHDITLWLMEMYRHTKLAYERFSSSEDCVWTNVNWHCKYLMWPWPRTQKSNISLDTLTYDDLPSN